MAEMEYTMQIPERIINIGDIVRIRPLVEILVDAANSNIVCGWNPKMNFLCGQEFEVTEEMVARNLAGEEAIFFVNAENQRFSISMSMLDFNTDDEKHPGLHNYVQDPHILEEMVKKVDVVRFKKLLCIAAHTERVTPATISNDIVMKYLRAWAKAKYDFYIIFDRNLTINKQIDVDMEDSDMQFKLQDLAVAHPQYVNLIHGFSLDEYLKNTCSDYNIHLRDVYAPYKRGAKLTKVLAGLTTDKSFNDDIANLMESRTIKTNIALSIDPYDYLTMSVNKYGWSSCQTIGAGDHCYATGGGSIMLDETTIIAYRYANKNVEYSMSNIKFAGNSKSWRQLIFVDKKHCNFITSREYPSAKDILAREIRLILEDKIDAYLGKGANDWVFANNGAKNYTCGSGNMYHDVQEGYSYKTAFIKNTQKRVYVNVGKDTFCTLCGHPIEGSSSVYLCDTCRQDVRRRDDDDDDERLF